MIARRRTRTRSIWWDWVGDHTDEIWAATVEHVQLTVIAVGVGLRARRCALALVALRWRWTYGPIAGFAGVLYTIPSLALFALLLPFFGPRARATAEIALVSYTLLILLRNIVAGLDGVPRRCGRRPTAWATGRWRRFFAVDLPLATPAIVAGIRIATVTTIGLVTVTALVGFGGFGALHQRRAVRRLPDADRASAPCLSVAAGPGARPRPAWLVERLLTPWTRRRAARR